MRETLTSAGLDFPIKDVQLLKMGGARMCQGPMDFYGVLGERAPQGFDEFPQVPLGMLRMIVAVVVDSSVDGALADRIWRHLDW